MALLPPYVPLVISKSPPPPPVSPLPPSYTPTRTAQEKKTKFYATLPSRSVFSTHDLVNLSAGRGHSPFVLRGTKSRVLVCTVSDYLN